MLWFHSSSVVSSTGAGGGDAGIVDDDVEAAEAARGVAEARR